VETDYYYDADGNLFGFKKNGTEYFYLRNGQNDIIGILDSTGTQVVSYLYDTWGKLISITGSLASTIGTQNPFRYRGYYYDNESGLYYLNSRYYDPQTGRFINADGQLNNSILGLNLFAYCQNNPINYTDEFGMAPGDEFATEEEAAKNFAEYYGQKSFDEDIEYGSCIYKVKHTTYEEVSRTGFWGKLLGKILGKKKITIVTYTYSYTEANTGDRGHVDIPNHKGRTAMVHTHGSDRIYYDNGDGTIDTKIKFSFSQDDLSYCWWRRINGYLASPGGYLYKYMPIDKTGIHRYKLEDYKWR